MSSEVANQENNSSELIKIRVKLIFHHGTVGFRMKKSMEMSNLFDHVAHRLRVPEWHLRFLLDGDRISPIETPEMLDWCDNNYQIDCFLGVPNCISFKTPKHRPFITSGNIVGVDILMKKTSVWFKDLVNIDEEDDKKDEEDDSNYDDDDDDDDGVNNDHANNRGRVRDSMVSGLDLPLLLLQKSRVLKTLVVGDYYRFGGGGVGELFFDALAKNVTLRALGLQAQHHCYPGPLDSWIEQLAAALTVNESLVSINLTGNFLGDRRVKWLGAALKVNTSLREMDLTHNGIGNIGSKWLGDALRENTNLFKIILCNNSICDRGADWIAKGLEVNNTLRQIDLSENRICNRGVKCLAAALKVNKSLSELWLSRNNFGNVGVESFVDALKVNKTLTCIKLGDGVGSINLVQQTRNADEITKDELIKAAEKNDERLLTLEAKRKRKYQELALKGEENAATIRSKAMIANADDNACVDNHSKKMGMVKAPFFVAENQPEDTSHPCAITAQQDVATFAAKTTSPPVEFPSMEMNATSSAPPKPFDNNAVAASSSMVTGSSCSKPPPSSFRGLHPPPTSADKGTLSSYPGMVASVPLGGSSGSSIASKNGSRGVRRNDAASAMEHMLKTKTHIAKTNTAVLDVGGGAAHKPLPPAGATLASSLASSVKTIWTNSNINGSAASIGTGLTALAATSVSAPNAPPQGNINAPPANNNNIPTESTASTTNTNNVHHPNKLCCAISSKVANHDDRSGATTTGPPLPSPPQQGTVEPIESDHDHAINYVTTIKRRFASNPKMYRKFLDILHTYKKEQRRTKEVLVEVSLLFVDDADLLKGFTYFLPDAVQEQAKAFLVQELALKGEENAATIRSKAMIANTDDNACVEIHNETPSKEMGMVKAPFSIAENQPEDTSHPCAITAHQDAATFAAKTTSPPVEFPSMEMNATSSAPPKPFDNNAVAASSSMVTGSSCSKPPPSSFRGLHPPPTSADKGTLSSYPGMVASVPLGGSSGSSIASKNGSSGVRRNDAASATEHMLKTKTHIAKTKTAVLDVGGGVAHKPLPPAGATLASSLASSVKTILSNININGSAASIRTGLTAPAATSVSAPNAPPQGNINSPSAKNNNIPTESTASANNKNNVLHPTGRELEEITHPEAILASKDELIQAAEKNDERLLTLEAELKRKYQDLALKDEEKAATIRSKDDKIAALEAALKNSKPIEMVDLTSGADVNDFSCTHNSASSAPLKKPRRDREEDRPKSIFQSLIQVKEEKQAAETALEDVRDDLDIAQTTLMQEAVYTDAWRTRFDELANIAKGAGVDGALIQGIRNRSFV